MTRRQRKEGARPAPPCSGTARFGPMVAALTFLTACATPAPSAPHGLRTLASETSLRQSPHPSAPSVAVLASGAPLEAVGESSPGWIEVRVPGGAGDPDGTAFVSTSQVEWVVECALARPARLAPGDTFQDCPFAPEMVVVPAGRFTMGTPESEQPRAEDEGPRREVTIAAPFAVGVYEVTYEEWEVCALAGPCHAADDDDGGGRGRWPVVNISWDVAQAYLGWLSDMTGHRYRLPSEAEWEYAARAGVSGPRPWDGGMETVCEHANVYDRQGVSIRSSGYIPHAPCEDGFQRSSPVGSYMPNAFGLYDVIGNAAEWVSDCYRPTYRGAPVDGSPRLQDPCPVRVLRGSGHYSPPYSIRLGYRAPALPYDEYTSYGIRVVTELSAAGSQADGESETGVDRSSAHELDRVADPLVPPDQARWEVLAEAAVRRAPHPDSSVVASFPRGAPLDVAGELPSWFEVAPVSEGGASPATGYVARSDAAWTLGDCSPPEEAVLEVGQVFRDCTFSPELAVVPAGRFTMGSPPEEPGRRPEELPQREVAIEAPFAVGVYEVTQREWTTCVRDGGCDPMDDENQRGPDMPQPNISWFAAQEYVAWLSEVTGRSYRMPTEAEWEYAARGGTQTAYWWGDDTAEVCAYENITSSDWVPRYMRFQTFHIAACKDGHARIAPVGSYRPNAFGIHDALGNVSEWVADCFSESSPSPNEVAEAPGSCRLRVNRGGSWFGRLPNARSAFRLGAFPRAESSTGGFRVVRELR